MLMPSVPNAYRRVRRTCLACMILCSVLRSHLQPYFCFLLYPFLNHVYPCVYFLRKVLHSFIHPFPLSLFYVPFLSTHLFARHLLGLSRLFCVKPLGLGGHPFFSLCRSRESALLIGHSPTQLKGSVQIFFHFTYYHLLKDEVNESSTRNVSTTRLSAGSLCNAKQFAPAH